ncbi:MAG: hypothetical protein RLZZ352_2521 [Pseudomonadota bacterium]|jgi:hypothetical protein
MLMDLPLGTKVEYTVFSSFSQGNQPKVCSRATGLAFF